ncbi:major facilitator superfamily domain-containing protein [Limtongia smithiae]|uniref:major facilitator superfamily domain-containing protein n=1 Tax=Limtongia smithiae TaxID=1125753 RepID=UPI0034CE620A
MGVQQESSEDATLRRYTDGSGRSVEASDEKASFIADDKTLVESVSSSDDDSTKLLLNDETKGLSAAHDYGAISDESQVGAEEHDYSAAIEKLLAEGKHAWSAEEEDVIRKKLDVRVMLWTCIMFSALQLVRNNIQNAISADFLLDANISQNEYNLGQSLFLLFFLLCEIPSQALVRRFGADIWLPILVTTFSVMSMLQILIKGPSFFLFTRSIIGACEGGFVPGLSFYLSSFYKANELSMRFSWVWATQSLTNVIGALLASGFIQIGGSLRGWQWLFLLEGVITTTIGMMSFFMMPSLRRKIVSRGFTTRETAILRVRISHDDPSKRNQQETTKFTKDSLFDGLKAVKTTMLNPYVFPIFLLGFVAFVPSQTANYYLTTILRQLGFSQIVTNLLTIPYAVINITMTVGFAKLSDRYRVRWIFALLSALWVLPCLIVLETIPDMASRYLRFVFITLIMGYPYYHPILISWISANSNDPNVRSMAFAIYNIFVQAGNILAANVYRESDAPVYHRGNGVLIGINVISMIIIVFIRQFFTRENKRRAKEWAQLDEVEREEYIQASKALGNRQLNFELKI